MLVELYVIVFGISYKINLLKGFDVIPNCLQTKELFRNIRKFLLAFNIIETLISVRFKFHLVFKLPLRMSTYLS